MGEMINQKRIEHRLTLRKFANELEKSPTCISLIESNMQIPTPKIREKIIEVLHFDDNDIEIFNSLILKAKNAHKSSNDANEKISGNSPVIIALRASKELAKVDKEWADFVKQLNKERAIGGFV